MNISLLFRPSVIRGHWCILHTFLVRSTFAGKSLQKLYWLVAKVAHAYFVSRKRLASMCIAKMVNHVMKTNALSFHKSQNVLGWSKFFVPDQKYI